MASGIKLFSLLMISGSALVSAQATMAQVAETASSDVGVDEGSSDIIVTATRRSERLLDVPVSLAVATGDSLRGLNMNAATDLQYVAPGLGMSDSNTPRGAGFRVRGIGTNVFADGIEQSVGVVIDGVPLARAGQGLADLIDIERVEVLRGPQGMLFGRNASAGLINIVTRRPTDVWSGEGRISYGEHDDLRASATMAGPISENVLARLTGFYNAQDGTVTNIVNDQELNNRKEYGARGSLVFTPADTTEIILRGDWSRSNTRGSIYTIRALAANSVLRPLLSPELIAAVGPENRLVSLDSDVFSRATSWGVSMDINQELGDLTLTSTTAYRKWLQADDSDADSTRFNILDWNAGSNRLNQFSQELRLASAANQPISFVVGALYYQSANKNTTIQEGRFNPSLALAAAGGVTVNGLPIGPVTPTMLGGRQVDIAVDVRDLAVFGQADIKITDQLSAIIGGRYTNTRVEADFNRGLSPNAGSLYNLLLGSSFAPLAYNLRETDDNLSFRLGLQYKPAPNANIYATVSRGYKGPGFDTQTDFALTAGQAVTEANLFAAAIVQPEIPTNYEFGFKGSFLERALDVSLSFYRTDFRNFQAQVFETPVGSTLGSYRIRNAGRLRSEGFELEINTRPTRGLSIGFGIAYNESKFRSFVGAACPKMAAAVGCSVSFDASGLDAPNAPRWTVSTNARWETALTDSVGYFLQGNAYLRSDNMFVLYPDTMVNPTQQDGYAIVNLATGLTFGEDRYTVSVFANNLFDTNFVSGMGDLPLGSAGDLAQFVSRDARRTIGVQLGVKF